MSHKQFGLPALTLEDFNRLTEITSTPIKWNTDTDGDGQIDVDEVTFLVDEAKSLYISDGDWNQSFLSEYQILVKIRQNEALQEAWNHHRNETITVDLSHLSPAEKKMAGHIEAACKAIDKLFMLQFGVTQSMMAEIEASDDQSKKDFFARNLGPWQMSYSPDPFANVLDGFPTPKYAGLPDPSDIPEFTSYSDFCGEYLGQIPDGDSLYTAIGLSDDPLAQGADLFAAVDYHEHPAFAGLMEEVAHELDMAAQALYGQNDEQALRAYLQASAKAFRTGDWDSADQAWLKLDMSNSKFHFRIGMSEPWFLPGDCGPKKNGFAAEFALIDRSLLDELQSLEEDSSLLEAWLADNSAFASEGDTQDFSYKLIAVQKVFSGGYNRFLAGGPTRGQSLPNDALARGLSGKKTTVFTGTYKDETSKGQRQTVAEKILPKKLQKFYRADDQSTAQTMVAFHEQVHATASFNLYDAAKNPDGTVKAGEDGEPLKIVDAMGHEGLCLFLEELRAQVGVFLLIDFYRNSKDVPAKKRLSAKEEKELIVQTVMWAVEQVAVGNSNFRKAQAANMLDQLFLKGGLSYDQNNQLNFDFKKIPGIMKEYYAEIDKIYATADAETTYAMYTKLKADEDAQTRIQSAELSELFKDHDLRPPYYTYEVTGLDS